MSDKKPGGADVGGGVRSTLEFRAWSNNFNRYMDRVFYESASWNYDKPKFDTHWWWANDVEYVKEEGLTTGRYSDLVPAGFRGDTKDITVEQYTGFKDKNGKKIYEGDIVKFGDSIAVIIWREERAEFGVRWIDCGIEDSLGWQIRVEKTPSEVIGNIHENQELISDKDVTDIKEEN